MSVFKRYNSIENSYREKTIAKIKSEGYDEDSWGVKEKVHGANFSISAIFDPIAGEFQVKAAKRSGFLKEGENFHMGKQIAIKYAETLLTMFQEIGAIETLTVYGEVFGGSYPHKDVPKDNTVGKVQKGVFYSPVIQFMAFDIRMDGKFLPSNAADMFFKEYEIPFLPNLFEGTFQECLDYSDTFQTTVPKMLGLPEIEDNTCEGIVIKPLNTVPYLYDQSRVILKKKNDKFKEVQETKKIKVQKDPLPAIVESMLHDANKYCTIQRVANVASKMGELQMSDFGKVLKETNIDAMEEFKKDYQESLNLLEPKYQKVVSKKMGSYNAVEVKAYFKENV